VVASGEFMGARTRLRHIRFRPRLPWQLLAALVVTALVCLLDIHAAAAAPRHIRSWPSSSTHAASIGSPHTAPATAASSASESASVTASQTQSVTAVPSTVTATSQPQTGTPVGSFSISSAPSQPVASTSVGSGNGNGSGAGNATGVPPAAPTKSEVLAQEAALAQEMGTFEANLLTQLGGSNCGCTLSIAISLGGDARAVASPTSTMPSASVAGHSGQVVSISYSAAGPATARATAGSAGRSVIPPAVSGSARSWRPQWGGQRAAIGQLVGTLLTGVVQDSADRAAAVEPDLPRIPDSDVPLQVQVASTSGSLDACPALQDCAVAVAVAVGGSASATVDATPSCAGSMGAANALAVSTDDLASATAGPAASSQCAATTADSAASSAVAGDTGNAYGIALAEHGPANADAGSGSLGAVTATGGGAARVATATSGSTGDVAGIAIGLRSATATVHSGDSGDAAALCSACASAAGAVSTALSGNTGTSFALAGAGLAATATANSGDSGDVHATAYGNTAGVQGAGGRVVGHSGDTGDAIAAAVDATTWVDVSALSGDAGTVVSVARGASPAQGSATVGPSKPSRQRVRIGPPDPGLVSGGSSATHVWASSAPAAGGHAFLLAPAPTERAAPATSSSSTAAAAPSTPAVIPSVTAQPAHPLADMVRLISGGPDGDSPDAAWAFLILSGGLALLLVTAFLRSRVRRRRS
jgi:hypothetical protein